ncbi:hypothetical protein CCY99_08000 [Helicobacter sp. 16-1353]|uniref:3-oxoacyl-[acyl-carrier-protein] synthase III C-terminal domain-containing protein n=1 Tax=Helicobacter sp. 16-1353 TaxID=2004996 RepID=UPI000DCB8FA8|nr:3-oxoacyl-[acyl-carrier-protein] synthase III C-terminal domain-containing protein [Helicobacter sp. 16-1353]RAX51893.1 hypothetical protein CCY99_08000 [Helicobacter sp. 16-1353]
MFASFEKSNISCMSIVLPQKEINIYDEMEYYGNSIKKIDRMRKIVGFHKRKVADSNTTASDLAIVAAECLIRDNNINRANIDCLINVTQEADYKSPSSAYYVHHKLGLSKKCIATDINQGCAGWVFGLYIAFGMIEGGASRNVLLLCADTPSILKNINDRAQAPLFGDGGVATFIEQGSRKSYFNIDTISDNFEDLILPFSGTRFLSKDKSLIESLYQHSYKQENGESIPFDIGTSYMDSMGVFNFAIDIIPKNIESLLKYAKKQVDSIDYLCLHQANKQIVKEIGALCGFDDSKVPYYAFEHFGNNTMCSIPTTIATLPIESKKDTLLCCGFGNGLVCASSILDMSDSPPPISLLL